MTQSYLEKSWSDEKIKKTILILSSVKYFQAFEYIFYIQLPVPYLDYTKQRDVEIKFIPHQS